MTVKACDVAYACSKVGYRNIRNVQFTNIFDTHLENCINRLGDNHTEIVTRVDLHAHMQVNSMAE